MAVYSIAGTTSNLTIGNANFELRASATKRFKVLEVGLFLASAVSSKFGIGRPQAIGLSPNSPLALDGEDIADGVSLATVALSWGTGPTVPLKFYRQISLPATVGVGVIWTFPKGITIPLNGSIVVWNLTAVGLCDAYAVIDE